MTVLNIASIEKLSLPGLAHQTLAGPRDGLRSVEVWMQTIAPGAQTPRHRHACEEVVVVLRGSGTCEIDGEVSSFGPGSTIILPAGVPHQIANTGADEMHVIAALGAAPVTVETPAGERIELPWDQHRFSRQEETMS
ncbi:dimethylsulfonioproprionate lyase family protein [Sorangium sp. So ce1389]|uniref:dimethylsulfonioproprionate lyase family protein n=1 Tax=Sorangium sp. So ce1389 TaxID=3133336 RepID=UPI003F5E865F